MKIWSEAWANGEAIPERFAAGRLGDGGVVFSDNLSPPLAWVDLPAGTQSLVLICHDFDVPSRGDDVNQEGRSVPADLPRVDFFHWILIDLPAPVRQLATGEYSREVTPRGKAGPAAPHGTRQGINDYTGWFSGDHDMRGDYYGYDGPCPPWNDERMHRYVFTVYALDIERLPIEGRFTGAEARAALQGHILAQASLTGTYTLNPKLAD